MSDTDTVPPAGEAPADATAFDQDVNVETTAPDDSQTSGEEGAESELPPIEPPKYWKASAKELFATLPRDVQEKLGQELVSHENEREAYVQRTKQEAAQQLQGLSTREQAAEQARQQYEAAVAYSIQQFATNPEFADIKSVQDEARVSKEDPFRYTQFLAFKEQGKALVQQAQQIQQQRAVESQQQFHAFAAEQDRLFMSQNPEFADPQKATQIREKVVIPFLKEDLGLSNEDLQALWSNPSYRDARAQKILYKAAKMFDAERKAAQAPRASQPAPQKPGTAGSTTIPQLEKMDMDQYVALRRKQLSAAGKR